METERECERRRVGQSQTRREQTKAVREKEGKDVRWRRRREGQAGKKGGRGGGFGGLGDEDGSCDSERDRRK